MSVRFHPADFLNWPAVQTLFSVIGPSSLRFVGGAVRNSLLGLPVTDLDLATTHLPDALIALAQQAGLKTVPTGIDHGTVTVIVKGHTFEVTTLRKDVSTDGRHAKVSFTENWREDAARRDFTINALYLDSDGTLYDYHQGLSDLQKGRVRFIGNPRERLTEDRLRALRFFRFSAAYAQGSVEEEGLRAVTEFPQVLDNLSAERIWSEFAKLLACKANAVSAILETMISARLDLNGLITPNGIAGVKAMGDEIVSASQAVVRLGALMLASDLDSNALTRELRLSKRESRFLASVIRAKELLKNRGDKALLLALYQTDFRAVTAAAAIEYPEALGQLQSLSLPAFPLAAADLIARGYEKGPKIGQELQRLESLFIQSDFSLNRTDLLARIEQP